MGLTAVACEVDSVFTAIRCMCAVPMLPSDLMWVGVIEIWAEVPNAWRQQLRPLFLYFKREWLPRKEELCVHNLANRTNNCSESAL